MLGHLSNSDTVLATCGLIVTLWLCRDYYRIVKTSISDVMDAEKPVEGVPSSKHDTAKYMKNRKNALTQGTVKSFILAYTMATTTQIVNPPYNPDIWYEYILDIYGRGVWENSLVGMFIVFSLLVLPLLLALVKKSLAKSSLEFMKALLMIFVAGWFLWLIIPY